MRTGQLVTRVISAQGSRTEQSRAYGEIVRRFQDMAFACAFALLGDTQLAEDAAQEAFLTAWRNLADLREPDAFPGWLRCIVRTQCCRMTRGKQLPTISLDSLPPLFAAPISQDPLHAAVRSEQNRVVHHALAYLPEHERVAAVLYYFSAWDQKQIAEFLEVPTTTVKKRLFSARRRLRERIAPIMFPDDTTADAAVRKALPVELPSGTSRFADAVALWTAIDTNDVDAVRDLLGRDRSLAGVRNEAGETPLHLACTWGHTEIVLALLRQGADHNAARTGDGATPLHALAAGSVRLDILDALLAAGVSPDTKDIHGRTAVQIAALRSIPHEEAEADSFGFAERLLDRGAAIDLWTAAALNRAETIPTLLGSVNHRNPDGDTPLHTAARSGHRPVIKALLDAGAEIDAANASGQTPLRIAVQPGRKHCCRKNASAETILRERGATTNIFIAALTGSLGELAALTSLDPNLINARDSDGATPLCLAAWNRQAGAVDWLLAQGADVGIRDNSGRGPASVRFGPREVDPDITDRLLSRGAPLELRTALALGRAEMVDKLLRDDPRLAEGELRDWAVEHVTDVSLTSKLFSAGAPADLFQAAAIGDTDGMRQFLNQKRETLHRRNRRHETALHIAAGHGNEETVAVLLSHGGSPRTTGGDGGTPLHRAARNGHSDVCALLLTHGARAAQTNFRGETALFDAVVSGNPELVRLLIQHGAPVDIAATGQTTPLHTAAERGDVEVLHLLVESGANLQATNHWGATPLHLAAREGHSPAVSLLLEAGADKTARDDWYRTPLHVAVWFGQTAVAEILLAAGSSVSELAYGYSTPLHTAAGAGHVSVAALLIAKGADVNYATDFKRTPLHDAVQSGSVEMVSLLLSHGADPNAANDRGSTPLHWAAASGKTEIAVRLRAAGADSGLRSGKKETPRDLALRHGNTELAAALA